MKYKSAIKRYRDRLKSPIKHLIVIIEEYNKENDGKVIFKEVTDEHS